MTSSSNPKGAVVLRRARPALGTFVEISASGQTRAKVQRAVRRAFEAIAKVERLMNVYDPASDIGRINARAGKGSVRIHAWTAQVLRQAQRLEKITQGAFDPTVNKESSPRTGRGGKMSEVRLLPNGRVSLGNSGLRLDLGGIAKGFAVDQALRALRRGGMQNAIVNAGGDLATFGPQGAQVWVRHPERPQSSFMQLHLSNGALANSGEYFRKRQGRSHLVRSERVSSRQFPKAAGVFARTCLEADALTKACLFAGRSAHRQLCARKALGYRMAGNSSVEWLGQTSWLSPRRKKIHVSPLAKNLRPTA